MNNNKKAPFLSIIIPARQEEAGIVSTLIQLERDVAIPHEILVIDDSIDAADRTPKAVAAYSKMHPSIVLIRKKPSNRDGFAAALSRGIDAAKGEAIVFVMADI